VTGLARAPRPVVDRPRRVRVRHHLQPDANFGRILAAYGGGFVAGSLPRGIVVDRFRPDRWDVIGAVIHLTGVTVIMYAPRPHA
jgi:drug/metabolite transporter superfamily protein YnfA